MHKFGNKDAAEHDKNDILGLERTPHWNGVKGGYINERIDNIGD